MGKIYVLLLLLSTVYTKSHAQIEGIAQDSIPFYLGHQWQEKARFLNGQQVAVFGEAMIYEFNENKSFIKKYDKKAVNGSWEYDSAKKVVNLQIDNRRDFYVVLLSRKELLLSAELYEGDKKGSGILVLLKRID